MRSVDFNKLLRTMRSETRKQIRGGRRKRAPRSHVLARIESGYSGGRPKVIMEDDPSNTPIGPYPYLNTYTPTRGDRVLMARTGSKYVILGKVE